MSRWSISAAMGGSEVKGDAGKRPGAENLLDVRGEIAAGWGIRGGGVELDVFGPVEGVHWAVQAGGCWIAEHELSDVGCAVGGRAVSEFGPAEQAGDVGVGGFGAGCRRAAVLAAAALAACGSASTRSPATPTTSAAASPSAAAAYNAADVAFTTGIIRLEGQARAWSGLAAAHTSSTQLRSYASQLGDDTADSQHMSGMMQQWHQALPSPYQPGPGMGQA
jgi:hypothetical protein